MNSHLKGSLFVILAMFLYSFQSITVRFISVNTFTLYAYIQVFFLFYISIYLLARKDYSSFRLNHPLKPLMMSIAMIIILMLSYYSAFRYTTIANVYILHYTAPIFALILSVSILKERFEIQSALAILLSIAGIVMMFSSSFSSVFDLGAWLALASGISYGILIVINKFLVSKGRYMSLLFWQTVPIFLLMSPFLFTELPTPLDIVIIASQTLLVGVIATIVYFAGLSSIKAQHAGIIAYIEILFAVSLGFIFFREFPGTMTWIGGALIILSGIWITITEARRKDQSKTI